MRPFHHITIVFFALLGMLLVAVFEFSLSWWWIVAIAVIYIHLLVLGAINIRWNFYLLSLSRGTNPNWICLTFDDGPATETSNILDILKEKDVKAAFFSIGKNARANPELVKRWEEEGHIIGNHSYGHGFNFDWKTAAAMEQEIVQTNEVIFSITGRKPRLFRPPYGVTNPNLAKAVRRTNMISVAWNVRSFDTTAREKQMLLDRILNNLQGGDIILLHDSVLLTRQILTEFIDKAREKGFTFVRLDKMLGIDAYI